MAYLAVAVIWTWPLARHVGTHTPILATNASSLARNDQAFSVSAVARNAGAIASGDWARLLAWRTCYPIPNSATLGEHAIEFGILGLPGYLATGNPVVAYNVACLLLVLIAATSTFCLVRRWTGSAAAGFFAGLAFGFHPHQITDLVHPFVIGIHWLPLVLLAFERLLEGGRVRDAVLLAIAGTLQTWVGSYPLLVFALFTGTYGPIRLCQLRHTLDARRLGLLAAAIGVVVGGAALVLLPYMEARSWGVHRRQLLLVPYQMLWPGRRHALGGLTVLLAVTLLGLRAVSRPSPVAAVVAAGAACILLAGAGVLWSGGPYLAAPYAALADRVWVLGIVRAPAAIRAGGYLAVSLLAGLALARLLSRLGTHAVASSALALTAAGLLLVESFHPTWTRRVYGISTTLELVPRAPDPRVLAPYRALDEAGLPGPVVEVPFDAGGRGPLTRMPYLIELAAYHHRETAACFTSHIAPAYHDVDRMVEDLRMLQPHALLELAAVGLRNVVVDPVVGRRTARILARFPGVRLVYDSPHGSSLHLTVAVTPHHDVTRLAPVGAKLGWFGFKGYWNPLVVLSIRNGDAAVWALPRPVTPLVARTRWLAADDSPATAWSEQATMLPLAVAGGRTATIRVPLTPPPTTGCPCRPEVEIPTLGWRVGSNEIDTRGWTPIPPGRGKPALAQPNRS